MGGRSARRGRSMRNLSAAAALRAIVEIVRVDGTDPVAGAPASAGAFAATLRASGVDAREVRIESPLDLDVLSLPAALLMAGGGWIVLSRRGRGIDDGGPF